MVGQATTLIRLGQTERKLGNASGGLAHIEEGFGVYFNNDNSPDLALEGWRALHRLQICDDPQQISKCREDAKIAWSSVERHDLVRDWLESN